MNSKHFYESYWKERININHIYQDFTPPRLQIATQMIMEDLSKPYDEVPILDIGCGEGSLGELLRLKLRRNLTIEGIDISETALQLADAYDRTVLLNVENDSLIENTKLGKYKYIVALEVMEHLFEPRKLLSKLRPLLRNDGYIITSFPNIAFWRYRLKLLFGNFPEEWTLIHPSEHLQTFTVRSFRKLLDDAGFKEEKLDAHYVLPQFFKPKKLFLPILRKFPNFFGYQVVIRAKLQDPKRK